MISVCLSLSFKIQSNSQFLTSVQFGLRSTSLNFEKKMAFERKRFCFNLKCNVTEDEYKDESNFKNGTYENGEKTKFKICTNCFIADFCGKTCQEKAKYFIPKITPLLSRSAHRTPNFTNPEFQFPQFNVLQRVYFSF